MSLTGDQPEDSILDNSDTLLWDEDGQPRSNRFHDIYFSKVNGLEESRYVFLDHNKLENRWQQLQAGKTFFIGETGFGTGLNFLAAWHLWNTCNTADNSRLHFFSVEKYPLSKIEMQQALSLWPVLGPLSEALLEHYPPNIVTGTHRLLFDHGRVCLTLFFGDADDGFTQLHPSFFIGESNQSETVDEGIGLGGAAPQFDAWFLDGFAPAKNPAMWSQKLLNTLGKLSKPGATFGTFTAAGSVRRALQSAGFNCTKVKGYGQKREMLCGTFEGKARPVLSSEESTISGPKNNNCAHYLPSAAWNTVETRNLAPLEVNSALVIGGGLAGCHTAFALANRNIKVTLVEQASELASKTSGNDLGVVYTKLSHQAGTLSAFNLFCQLFANHFYASRDFYQRCGQQCGVLHLAYNGKQLATLSKIAQQFRDHPDFVSWLAQPNSTDLAGIELCYPGLFIPNAGWLDPVKLCLVLSTHPNINVVCNFDATHLNYNSNRNCWQALDTKNKKEAHADIAVIANAQDALKFSYCAQLPLKAIRGQTSALPASSQSQNLNCVICGNGYIAPARNKHHTVGATYTLQNNNPNITASDHRQNIRNIALLSNAFNFDGELANSVSGRTGFRCTTPDYFPMVGPVHDLPATIARFAALRKNAKANIQLPGCHYPSLYLNLGFGSRGLAYAPLCAELLASIICAEPLPISSTLYSYLNPIRFTIRNLQRSKI